jgi:hypothetical protein
MRLDFPGYTTTRESIPCVETMLALHDFAAPNALGGFCTLEGKYASLTPS